MSSMQVEINVFDLKVATLNLFATMPLMLSLYLLCEPNLARNLGSDRRPCCFIPENIIRPALGIEPE